MSQENFNETSILNDTELINGTIPSWRTDYEGDWWTILIVSSGKVVESSVWDFKRAVKFIDVQFKATI